jgi:hypothetical protein
MSGLPSPEICQRILALWVVLGEPDWTETDRLRLINLLTQYGQSVSDRTITSAIGVAQKIAELRTS